MAVFLNIVAIQNVAGNEDGSSKGNNPAFVMLDGRIYSLKRTSYDKEVGLMAIRVLLLILIISFSFSIGASAEGPLKAAFIRDHQLWIKEGDKELQLTTGQYVSSPKWSKDGQFIAYLAGKEEGGKRIYIFMM